MKRSPVYTLLLALTATVCACTSNEIGESKDVAQDKIYQSYSIRYNEGDPAAEVYCQFRFAGQNGTTLVLSNPSQLQLDGEKIKADSSDYSGAFYKTSKPAGSFYGRHSFSFTTTDNKSYNNSFSFDAFRLVNIPAAASKKQDLSLPFETTALKGDDYISLRSVNTDSSFDISHNYADGNAIKIPAAYLQKQTGKKELTVEASLTRKTPLQQATSEGGRLQIHYTLKPVKITLTD